MKDIRKKFCPKCGRDADRLHDGMCIDCFFEKKRTVDIPERIVVKRCKRCGRYFSGKVMSENIEGVVSIEMEKIRRSGKKSGVKTMNYRLANGKAYVSLKLDFDGMQKSEEHVIEIYEKPVVCQYCAMAGTHYYNAVVQIRAGEQVIERALAEARKRIGELKSDKMAFITDVKKMKNGADVYIGSKAAAAKVARTVEERFKQEFNVETKKTRKLTGKKQGSNVYRDTILIFIE